MKKFLIVVTLVFLVSLFLPGCGCGKTPQSEEPEESALQEEICEAVGDVLTRYQLQCEADLRECEKEKVILQDRADDFQGQLADCNAKRATLEKQIADLKDQLAKLAKCDDCSKCEAMLVDCQDDLKSCQDDLKNCQSKLDICQDDIKDRDRRICELLEELEECEGWSINAPQVVGSITHRQMIEFLREVFPNAEFRGVEEAEFDLTNKSEVERFLDEMPERSFSDQGDLVWRLMGEFTGQSGWEDIPIGWAKVSDGEFYPITVVKEGSQLVAFKIRSSYSLERISSDSNVKWCLVG